MEVTRNQIRATEENLEKKYFGMACELIIKEKNQNLESKILELREGLVALINQKTGELAKSQN